MSINIQITGLNRDMNYAVDLTRDKCEERLRNALLDVTLHPERWEQGDWAGLNGPESRSTACASGDGWPCGAVACLAGNVVIREGLVDIDYPTSLIEVSPVGRALVGFSRRELDDEDVLWASLAQLLLGLSTEQANLLFDSCNDLSKLWELADTYTSGRVRLPAELEAAVDQIDTDRG